MPNVSVNLAVEIDASGTIQVFGQQFAGVTNKVVADVKLPVRALYDAAGASNSGTLNSLFEFWEPSSALGTRLATLSGKDSSAASEGRDYTKMEKKLAMDLQEILMGEFDCSGAKPFDGYGSADYTTVPHFGRLALSSYAHYLFGHVAATAAITNDGAFMKAMMSTKADVVDGSSGAYKYDTTADVIIEDTASVSDANLAARLVHAIVSKNDTAILAIVEQVLGQDASRAMDQDNNVISPDVRQELRFEEGDKIYLNIRLKRPQVTISTGTNAGAPASTLFPDDVSADVNYTLEITLEARDGAAFAAGGSPAPAPAPAPAPSGTPLTFSNYVNSGMSHNVEVSNSTSTNYSGNLRLTTSGGAKIDPTTYSVGANANAQPFNFFGRSASTFAAGDTVFFVLDGDSAYTPLSNTFTFL
jgi:hypothetical protein